MAEPRWKTNIEDTKTGELIKKTSVRDMLDLPSPPRGIKHKDKYRRQWSNKWKHPEWGTSQCDTVVKVMMEGGHQARACCELGISPTTFIDWYNKYDEFRESVDVGMAYSEAFYEELLLKGSAGFIPNFNVRGIEAILRAKHRYLSERGKGETHIDNLTISSNVDPSELGSKIELAMKQLKRLEMKDG